MPWVSHMFLWRGGSNGSSARQFRCSAGVPGVPDGGIPGVHSQGAGPVVPVLGEPGLPGPAKGLFNSSQR